MKFHIYMISLYRLCCLFLDIVLTVLNFVIEFLF